jgi:hypothetical protein
MRTNYLSSEEYDLMLDGEYEQWLLNQNKKYKEMIETVNFVVSILVRGIPTDEIYNDFKVNYFEEIESANESDFAMVLGFYETMEDDILEKRRMFLVSCDYSPSENLEDTWNDEVADFYSDLYFN